MRFLTFSLVLCLVFATGSSVQAQHLWWDLSGQTDATCLYGEVTVLATHPAIYYCGANWHPCEPAGGYCGIQDNSTKERRTIFSIWDTTDKLHPRVTAADDKTMHDRFGGEGTGAPIRTCSGTGKWAKPFSFLSSKSRRRRAIQRQSNIISTIA